MEYQEFINSKHQRLQSVGFKASINNPMLFDWQVAIVEWALRRGVAALFCECGLGKTAMQLAWADAVSRKLKKPVLILAPLAVAEQTRREGEKFGYAVNKLRDMKDLQSGINVSNYEMLHNIDVSVFGGVVLDESSILKAFMGKTRLELTKAFKNTRYKLCCTATPAPNDYTELGNHAEFLGIGSYQEMLAKWFINDSYNVGAYRLKGHAVDDFWRWVAQWAVCIQSPADLGYDGSAFQLPPLETIPHVVQTHHAGTLGFGFVQDTAPSATELHSHLRKTTVARADKAYDIVYDLPIDDPVLIWCFTDYDADELLKVFKDEGAKDVRGSMPIAKKEEILTAFSDGELPILITKPKIAGWGLNWQHCNQMITVSPTYSFESRYQAIRRCWRFGQMRPVYDHVVMADTERAIFKAAQEKEQNHMTMADAIARVGHALSVDKVSRLEEYEELAKIKLPSFLR